MQEIAANLAAIRERIDAACRRCGREPSSVRLIAVSKKKPAELIEAAARAGQSLFGENYVQELVGKLDEVALPVEWHYIGALQSNKVKYLAGRVAMIHSVDRLSLAEEISRQWQKHGEVAELLVQFNLGEEASKSGASEAEALELVRSIAALPALQVRGLMILPPFLDDPEQVRPFFRQLRELRDAINAANLPGVKLSELSMGMSHDFEVAIEEGATLVRVGTAIFGERN